MTTSKSYVLPEQVPDAILIRKADLGGYTLEAIWGEERKIAAFTGTNTLAGVVSAMLLGQQTLKVVEKATEALKAAKAVKPAKTKKVLKAVTETPVAEAKEAPKRRGRPKGSKNRPKANGKIEEVQLAA